MSSNELQNGAECRVPHQGEGDETAVDAGNASAPNAPGRFKGRFLPGHTETRTHALNTDRVPAFYLQQEAALLAQSIADDGGATEIPARRMAQHEYRALVHRKVWQLSDAIDSRGMFDKRGKLRVAWLQRLESLINLATKIDASLGLERRAKQLPNPADWLEGKA